MDYQPRTELGRKLLECRMRCTQSSELLSDRGSRMYIEFEDSVTDILKRINEELKLLLDEEDVKFVYMGIRDLAEAVNELAIGDVSKDNVLLDEAEDDE